MTEYTPDKWVVVKIEGKNVQINWYYKSQDEDLLEDGEMFNELNEVPINMIAY